MRWPRKKISGWLRLAGGLVVVSFVWSSGWTALALHQLHSTNVNQVAVMAQVARPPVTLARTLTAHQIASLNAWDIGLQLLPQLPALQQSLTSTADQLPAQLETSINLTQTFLHQVNRSWLLTGTIGSYFIPSPWDQAEYRSQLLSSLASFQQLLPLFSAGEHRYLLLLQNSRELRATGGFAGSFVVLTVKDGRFQDWTVHDIYEPDGQFQGYMEAPPGVKEYLSSGQGLRLPDANWFPDFPTSAQAVLSFLAVGEKNQIDGVIALNLELGEKMLAALGPVYLADYQVEVTAENLAEVARADRERFFPGSYQKPHFMRALLTQVKLKWQTSSPTTKQAVLTLLQQAGTHKEIQLYSPHPELEAVIDQAGLGGRLTSSNHPQHPLYLAWVESNVGINKINPVVKRDITLTFNDRSWLITGTFSHQQPATKSALSVHLPSTGRPETTDYINYQRVYLHPAVKVKTIKVGEEQLESWHSRQITTQGDETFLEVGFLVPVKAGQTQTAYLELELPQPVTASEPLLILQKQSGLASTNYTVQINQQPEKTFTLDHDEQISW